MTTTVASTLVPTNAVYPQLWTPVALMMANWAQRVETTTVWQTRITQAQSLAEKRVGRTIKPSLVVTYGISAFNSRDAWHASSIIARMGQARSLVPIVSDHSTTNININAGDTTISCEARYRRFTVGGRIAIGRTTSPMTIDTFELATVTALGSGLITVSAPITGTYPFPTRIYPLIEADLQSLGSFDLVTTNKFTATITAKEVVGASSLGPTGPATNDVYSAYPVLSQRTSWETMTVSFQRMGDFVTSGTFGYFDLRGTRALTAGTFSIRGLKRSDLWNFVQFFDDTAGMLRPFYFMLPFSPFTVTAVTTTSVTFTANGPAAYWDQYSCIGIQVIESGVLKDYVRTITASTSTSVTWTLAIASLTITSIKRVCPAIFCRFSSDELTTGWATDGSMDATFSVIEVQNEGDKSIGDTTPPDGPPGHPPPGTCPTDCTACSDAYTGTLVLTTGITGLAAGTYTGTFNKHGDLGLGSDALCYWTDGPALRWKIACADGFWVAATQGYTAPASLQGSRTASACPTGAYTVQNLGVNVGTLTVT